MDRQKKSIVVGYDGSAPADAALDWAAAQAERCQVPLRVVSIVDAAGLMPGFHDVSSTIFQERAEQSATLGAQRAAKNAGSIEITSTGCVGQISAKLIELSDDAGLLVLGRSGQSELAGAVLGSVAFTVSAHAHSPVVVVREESVLPGPDRPVIVGVDGSLCARIAARQAADLAAEAGAVLRVVTTYRAFGRPDPDGADHRTAELVAHAAATAAAEAHDTLRVESLAVVGSAARELPRLAKDCGLLVVGTRGYGGFAGLLLGSVSHGVMRSAPCPVMVVPVVVS